MLALNRTLALLALSALPAGAEETGPLKTAELSARVHAAGLATGDPLILLTAAQLRKEAGLPPDLFEPGLKVWRYTVTKWGEARS